MGAPILADPGEWTDWRWQQRSAVRSITTLREIFPGLAPADAQRIALHGETMRFQATRFFLSRVRQTADRAPDPADPLWRQIMPAAPAAEPSAGYQYDGTENWEMPSDMVTPIAQHKYDDRLIIRLSNVCHSYCQFCYEALRTLEKHSEKSTFSSQHWIDTLEYVARTPAIREVILSGGEPFMHSDQQLSECLRDLRSLPRQIAIRIHTRALTFNPFRITQGLCEVLGRYEVNSIGIHVAHPNEVSPEFEESSGRLGGVVPILFANIPLLREINDTPETITDLSMKLYMLGIGRGYLYHFMPHSPGSEQFRTLVRTGIDITRLMKRRVSNLAVPEYVLPHHSGKHTMPLLLEGESAPFRTCSESGEEMVRFTNWLGETVDYPDPPIREESVL